MLLKALVLCSLLISFAVSATDCKHTDNHFKCLELVSLYDGDTITVNIPGLHPMLGKKAKIRLKGMDTPEMRTDNHCEKIMAIAAKMYLEHRLSLSQNNRIEIRNAIKGKYFRIVGDLWVNGRNMSRALIAKNLAVPYDGGTKTEVDWCTVKPKLPREVHDRWMEKVDHLLEKILEGYRN